MQSNTILDIWLQLNLPTTNSFINTMNLISTQLPSNNNFPFQLHYQNNQNIFISQYHNPQKTSFFHIKKLPSDQTSLISIPSLPSSNLSSFNLPYNQIKKLNNLLSIQIDYKEILALIHIFTTTQSHPLPQLIPHINITSSEVQTIQQTTNSTFYQNQLINLYFLIQNLHPNNLEFYIDASIKNLQTPDIKAGIG